MTSTFVLESVDGFLASVRRTGLASRIDVKALRIYNIVPAFRSRSAHDHPEMNLPATGEL